MNLLTRHIYRLALLAAIALAPALGYAQEDKPKSGKDAPKTAEKVGSGAYTDLFSETDSANTDNQKPKKKPKRVYMGHKFKKGYTKTGKGKSRTIEQFGYLKVHQEPKAYLMDKYYYDVKRKKLFKGRELPKKDFKILHGPYKKLVAGKVVEEGHFNIGGKHGRWERYNRDFILLAKEYYDNGLPRDAEISYYDAGRTKLKQVIPWEWGEKTGQYLEFYENGQLHWQGWYEKGVRVGVWTEYYDFRNRRHYQYQYAESAYEEPFEPYLIREYDRNGNTVFELKTPGPKQPVRARK